MDRSVWYSDLYARLLSALLLIGIVLGLYWPALGYEFVWEDRNDLARFTDAPTLASLIDGPSRMVTGWTYALSAVISPLEPWGYHLISILLHALNTCLLFALGAMIWRGAWLPFVCAALFAVHPIQTEAVAYISARADLVMTTCTLLALIAAERERWSWMLLACVVAVGAKESGIVAFPLAMMWALGRWKRVPVWLFLASIVGALVGASALITLHGVTGPDLSYTATETAKLWSLLSKVLIPFDLSIDPDYQFPAAWPMVTLIGTVALGCYALISSGRWSFGVLFMLIALSPRLLTPLVEGIHEHHLYLSLAGITLAFVGSFAGSQHGISETLPQA